MKQNELFVVCKEECLEECKDFYSYFGYKALKEDTISKDAIKPYRHFCIEMFEKAIEPKPEQYQGTFYFIKFEKTETKSDEIAADLEERFLKIESDYNDLVNDYRVHAGWRKNPLKNDGPLWLCILSVAVDLGILIFTLIFYLRTRTAVYMSLFIFASVMLPFSVVVTVLNILRRYNRKIKLEEIAEALQAIKEEGECIR